MLAQTKQINGRRRVDMMPLWIAAAAAAAAAGWLLAYDDSSRLDLGVV